jgi:YqaJ-like viral recombinase domain
MPVVHQAEQGSPEWFALRVGIPTASCFHKIVTPTGKLSAQAAKYAYFLAAERLLGRSLEPDLNGIEAIRRGHELEPEAVQMYEFDQDVDTTPVGFITTDDGRIGASPDRLIVGRKGALEIKCPLAQTHVQYMIEGFGADYTPQAQGQIAVAELEWVDRYSYHPEMPPVHVRTYRDEAYQRLLVPALVEFCELLETVVRKCWSLGVYRVAPEQGATGVWDKVRQVVGAEPHGTTVPHDFERGLFDKDPFGFEDPK